jgi:hypothetical protein
MQHVQVFHVGSSSPTVVPDADFYCDPQGDLTVSRRDDTVARFPAGKWSAVIKMDVPASMVTTTR